MSPKTFARSATAIPLTRLWHPCRKFSNLTEECQYHTRNGWPFLFLNGAAVKFGDRALDCFNGTVLVYRLDVHGDNLAGIHVQKNLSEVGR